MTEYSDLVLKWAEKDPDIIYRMGIMNDYSTCVGASVPKDANGIKYIKATFEDLADAPLYYKGLRVEAVQGKRGILAYA